MTSFLTKYVSRRHVLAAAAAVLSMQAGVQALAQAQWPSKPIRFVVGFPAGGSTDVMARVVGASLSQSLGQPVVVDNRPGASSNIAAIETIKSAPDGYTFMVAPISVQTANPFLFKPALNPERDLRPVASVGYAQLYLVTKKDLPVASVKELVVMAQAQPDKLSYGSGGTGTQMHLVGELFKQQAKIDALHVPYKGGAPALQDLLAGQIDYYFDPASGLPHIGEGKARLLAVTGNKRSPFFPDTPTLTELGIPGVELGNWFGVFAPAGTPVEITQRLEKEIQKAVSQKDVKQRFAEMGSEAIFQDGKTFNETIQNETKVLSALIKERNLVLE